MDADVNSSTASTDCWPTIRITSAAGYSPTGSDSRPAAYASATIYQWSSAQHHVVHGPTVALMHQNPIPSRLPRRRSNGPFTNMPRKSGIAHVMSSISWRTNPIRFPPVNNCTVVLGFIELSYNFQLVLTIHI